MNHFGTKLLETKRLILRRFNIDDIQAMYDNWASDDDVTKYLTWQSHKSTDITREYLESLIASYEQLDTYNWGIELKELKQVIGSIGVVSQNQNVASVHIGYCIGKKWWNKGITSESLQAVIKYLMDEVKVNRIDSRHDSKNINSGKVMEKCGLKYEGTLRESDLNNQGLCDADWYSLLRSEYIKNPLYN